jgi:hypothetical protein
MSKWISVKDRLPNDGDEVLIHNGNYHWIGCFELENNGFMCGEDHQGYERFYSIEEATHWQPLPEPPK